MKTKSILMMLGIAGRAMVICGLLAASALANDTKPGDDENARFRCTNATLHGDYGFTVNGTIFPVPPAFGVPNNTIYIQGVQMMYFDGKGNVTDNEALVLNGVPLVNAPPSYFSVHTGNYALNPNPNSNCTGLAFLTNGTNFIWLSFVVDKRGKQIRMVGVPPFDSGGLPRTVTSTGEKVE